MGSVSIPRHTASRPLQRGRASEARRRRGGALSGAQEGRGGGGKGRTRGGAEEGRACPRKSRRLRSKTNQGGRGWKDRRGRPRTHSDVYAGRGHAAAVVEVVLYRGAGIAGVRAGHVGSRSPSYFSERARKATQPAAAVGPFRMKKPCASEPNGLRRAPVANPCSRSLLGTGLRLGLDRRRVTFSASSDGNVCQTALHELFLTALAWRVAESVRSEVLAVPPLDK